MTGEHVLNDSTHTGIYVIDGAADNTIGGTAPARGNVISGNGQGVFITAAGPTGNVVEGNLIGTDKTGTVALGNTRHGILIDLNAQSNTIGGTAAGAGNVISGNRRRRGSRTCARRATSCEGNLIGTNAAGTAALANTDGDGHPRRGVRQHDRRHRGRRRQHDLGQRDSTASSIDAARRTTSSKAT